VQLMFWVKVHKLKYSTICAACDENILGKKLNFNGITIEIKERFYKGELVDEEKLKEILNSCNIGNLFGKETIEVAKKINIIDERNILYIDGVPHAQFIK